MKRIAFGFVCLFMLSAQTWIGSGPPPIGRECAITVRFGSACCGRDGKTEKAINTFIANEPKILGKTAIPWGREGEIDLCLKIKSNSDTQEIFDHIKSLIPPVSKYPTQIFSNGGAHFSSQWPKDDK
ncbi:MAG: hypothetical protein WA138_08605 [Parvibaculum sp.]